MNFLIRWITKNQPNAQTMVARTRCGTFAGMIGIVLNLLLAGTKLLTGWAFTNLSILADGLNNLTDATSCIITLIGFRLASRPADREHPFGHARMEYISGLAIAFVVMFLGLSLARSAIDKILHPATIQFSLLLVIVLFGSVLVKLWMYLFYLKLAIATGSTALKATGTDCRNDMFATTAVLISVIIAYVWHINLDGYMGFLVSIYIVYSGIGLIRETLDPLLGRAPDKALVKQITDKILSFDGVLGMHDLMVHDYGPNRCFASAHVETDASKDVMESHDLTDIIERAFIKDGIQLVVHLDPIVTNDPRICSLKEMVLSVVKEIDPTMSIHDFRAVIGVKHTNLIFDVLVSPEQPLDQQALIHTITQHIKAIDPTYYPVFQIDQNYISLQ